MLAKHQYIEWNSNKKYTIDFGFPEGKDAFEASMHALVAAREQPDRARPRDNKETKGVCGIDMCTYDHTTDCSAAGTYEKLTIKPKEPGQASFWQTTCAFTHCSKTLREVVANGTNVYVCSACRMFICHECKKFVPLKKPRKKKQRLN